MSHTKGEWTKFNDRIEVQGQFHDTVICRVENLREKSANQNLIAAAPDLLDACKSFLELFRESDMRPEDECHEIADMMTKAIDKAEGR